MRAWGILGASALLLASCSGADSDTPQGDFRVVVEYDSTMSVATFAVAAVSADGEDVWARSEHDAPLDLDPPGIRQAELQFERPAEGNLTVLVDGLSGEGAVVGSGRLEVLVDAELESVQVRLGAPVVCGDGQKLGREQCDDGGAEAGDGCSALCMIEPGWTCEGIPSRCGRCGDGTQSAGEQCDDGNMNNNDSCAQCRLNNFDTVFGPTSTGTSAVFAGALEAGSSRFVKVKLSAPGVIVVETGVPTIGLCDGMNGVNDTRVIL